MASVSVAAPASSPSPPRLLYVPSAGDQAPSGTRPELAPSTPVPARRCPPDMVSVADSFCIDRYEATLVDARSGSGISPHFHPSRHEVQTRLRIWRRRRHRAPVTAGRLLGVPEPPAWQLQRDPVPRAVSRRGVLPNGYLSLPVARAACRRAGKRLCTEAEWERACRGEADQRFPYGERYEHGRCNVFREAHPAAELHGDASRGHLDPRLNLVRSKRGPLLRPTGATRDCGSRWGDDRIHDMVGNLDEWVEGEDGVFRGGFFSRSTREGCSSRISAHPPSYFDYSLGVRCCR